jgi:dihydrofolate reductase
MSKLRLSIAMSLDGFVAGPEQGEENPIGIGGDRLHEWLVPLRAFRQMHGEEGGEENASNAVVEEAFDNVGATVMGRNMFGGGSGDWGDEPWMGWWGEERPFHHPVFVITHHSREPVEMRGGTKFHFVTDGIESALEQARATAGGKDVSLGGGASVAQQSLAAGLLDEIQISLVPVLLHAGERLFDNLDEAEIALEQVRAVEAPGVTHLKYRVGR